MPPFLFDQNKFENHAYCKTATSYSSRLPVQVLLILPNLWILGFAMSVPQVERVLFVFLVLDCFIEKINKFLRIRLKASWMKPWWKSCQISKPCIDESDWHSESDTRKYFPFCTSLCFFRFSLFLVLFYWRFWCSFVTPQGTIKFPPKIISLLSQLDLFIGVQCSLGNVHS